MWTLKEIKAMDAETLVRSFSRSEIAITHKPTGCAIKDSRNLCKELLARLGENPTDELLDKILL